jgi:hypothetical protein
MKKTPRVAGVLHHTASAVDGCDHAVSSVTILVSANIMVVMLVYEAACNRGSSSDLCTGLLAMMSIIAMSLAGALSWPLQCFNISVICCFLRFACKIGLLGCLNSESL